MGAFPLPPPLPAPPTVQGPQAPGPGQGYMQPPTQAQSTPPPAAANIVQGIASFMQQFGAQKEQKRQQSANQAQQNLQNLILGLPVDLKKTARLMKSAGMDLDFESATTQAPPAASTMAGAGAPISPGGSNVPLQSNVGGPPVSQPPTAPTDVWNRIKQMMTGGPPIQDSSPGMAALRQLQQRGQQNVQTAGLQNTVQQQTLANEGQKQAILTSAMSGNPQAGEQAQRLGLMKDLPGDEVFRMGKTAGLSDPQIGLQMWRHLTGEDKMNQELMTMAKEWAPRFDGRLDTAMQYVTSVAQGQSPPVQPSMTFDEKLKVTQLSNDMQKERPMLPSSIADTAAMQRLTNGTVSKGLQAAIDKFPTTGEIDWSKWTYDKKTDAQKFGFEVARFTQEHNLAVVNSAREGLGAQFQEGLALSNKKDASTEEVNTGNKMMADAIAKKGKLTVTTPGGTFALGIQDISTRPQYTFMHPFGGGANEITINSPQDLVRAMKPPAYMNPEESAAWTKELKADLDRLGLMQTPDATGPGVGSFSQK